MGEYFAVPLECPLSPNQFISRRRQWIVLKNWEQHKLLEFRKWNFWLV
jgi:hypothetical protein